MKGAKWTASNFGWYFLLKGVPAEVLAFQCTAPNKFWQRETKPGQKSKSFTGPPTPSYWSFDGRFIQCKIHEKAWPEEVRRHADALYRFYGEIPPNELTFKGSKTRAKPWKSSYKTFWNVYGGLPERLRRMLKKHDVEPDGIVYNTNLRMEAWRAGVLEFLKRNHHTKLSRHLQWWRFVESVWCSLVLACESIGLKLPGHRQSFLATALLSDPQAFAESIKRTSSALRRLAFMRDLADYDGLLLWPELSMLPEPLQLQWSMAARSLPAPLEEDHSLLPKYFDRMSKTVPAKIDSDVWVADWFRRFKPHEYEHRPFSLGTSACAELSRAAGGLIAAIGPLIVVGKSHYKEGIFDMPVDPKASSGPLDVGLKWRWMIYGSLVVCEALQSQGIIPAAFAISAPEKGLKTRIPTAGIAPVVVIQHVLRGYIDQVMERDIRIGPSISPGDPLKNDISPSSPFMGHRSVDATTATDLHPFEWQRSLYRGLLDTLPEKEFFQRVRKLIPWLFGPRTLFQNRSCIGEDYPFLSDKVWHDYLAIPLEKKNSLRRMMEKPNSGIWAYSATDMFPGLDKDTGLFFALKELDFGTPVRFFEGVRSMYAPNPHQRLYDETASGPSIPVRRAEYQTTGKVFATGTYDHMENRPMPQMLADLVSFHKSYQKVEFNEADKNRQVTVIGAMMGEPTSWPGLALLNVWTWEESVPLERRYSLRTTGDDAEGFLFEEESELWTKNLTSKGVVISSSKDYFDKGNKYGLYTEVVTDSVGLPLGCLPLSTLVGPEGGTKGTESWATAPSHTLVVANRCGASIRKTLWKLSRFWPQWVAARAVGLELNFPERWGGIKMPSSVMRCSPPQGNLRRWARLMSDLTTQQLILGEGTFAIHKSQPFGPNFREVIIKHQKREVLKMAPPGRRAAGEAMFATPAACKPWIDAHLRRLFSAFKVKEAFLNPDGTLPPLLHAQQIARGMRTTGALDAILSGARPEPGEKVPAIQKAGNRYRARLKRAKGNLMPLKLSIPDFINKIEEKGERYLKPPYDESKLVTPPDVQRLWNADGPTPLLAQDIKPSFPGLVTRQ